MGATCRGGVCVPIGLVGDFCSGTDFNECSPFYVCDGSSTCNVYPELGTSCMYRCAANAHCEMGTCVAQLASGAACNFDSQCESHLCKDAVCAAPITCI
jgi:hypothetical protein